MKKIFCTIWLLIYDVNAIRTPKYLESTTNPTIGPYPDTYTVPKNTVNPLFKSLLCIIASQ